MNLGTLVGTLRSWKDAWGFVVCPEAFQGDLFLHKDGFAGGAPPVGVGLNGATVQFERGVDQKGRAHAKNVVVLHGGSHQGPALRAGSPGTPGACGAGRAVELSRGQAAPTMLPPGGFGGLAPAAATPHVVGGGAVGSRASPDQLLPLVGQRLRGEIRSWKEEWGFVVCPSKFHGDIFAHNENIRLSGPPEPGKLVQFQVQLDSRGRPAATEIMDAGSSAEDFIGRGQLMGHIRSWKKDWGFIQAPEYFEGDLFCHQDSLQLSWEVGYAGQLEEMLQNRSASFEVVKDKRGRLCASNVLPSGEPPTPIAATWGAKGAYSAEAPMGTSEMLEGTLRSWKDPWGFIVCPESFAGDLFVHKDVFVDPPSWRGQILEGARVRFRRALDHKGRAHAVEVTLLAPGAAAPGRVPGTAAGFSGGEAGEGLPGAAAQAAVASAGPVPAKFLGVLGHTLEGTVRSWKDDWGFVICPQAFEGDLFVHRDNLGLGPVTLLPGTKLSFQVSIDPKGRATATSAKCLGEAGDWAGSGQEFRGTIRSWKEPWGFVVSPGSFAGDLFFHQQYSPLLQHMPPMAGLEVTFRVEVDLKGRATAVDLKPVPRTQRRSGGCTQAPDAKRVRTVSDTVVM